RPARLPAAFGFAGGEVLAAEEADGISHHLLAAESFLRVGVAADAVVDDVEHAPHDGGAGAASTAEDLLVSGGLALHAGDAFVVGPVAHAAADGFHGFLEVHEGVGEVGFALVSGHIDVF